MNLFVNRFVVSPAANGDNDNDQVFVDTKESSTRGSESRASSRKPSASTPINETPTENKSSTPTNETTPRSRPQTPDAPSKPSYKLSHDWLPTTAEEGSHHLTIGPHPGADWVRRLALDKTRKTSEPEVGSKSGGEGLSSCRSTDCIPKDSSSSDSDLLRSAPPWTRSKFRFSPEKETKQPPEMLSAPEPETKPTTPTTPTLPDLPITSAGAGATPKVPDPAEIAAKKQRIKQSLMKRARSVAIFSLKLKERRAREGKITEPPKPKDPPRPVWGAKTEGPVGGELGCIPIEMLISVDDVAKDLQRRQNPST